MTRGVEVPLPCRALYGKLIYLYNQSSATKVSCNA